MCSLNKLKLNKLNCGVGELGRNEGEIDSISNWKIMQENHASKNKIMDSQWCTFMFLLFRKL
jgi:hypothetical protein